MFRSMSVIMSISGTYHHDADAKEKGEGGIKVGPTKPLVIVLNLAFQILQKSTLCLLEDLDERYVGHDSGRDSQRGSQDSAGGEFDQTGKEDDRCTNGS